jgi:hypothetical protein
LENKRKIILNFFDISNSVRKNFLNLNVADIGAKKRSNHVLRRFSQGKCVLNLKAMLHGAIFLATCNAILLLRDVN